MKRILLVLLAVNLLSCVTNSGIKKDSSEIKLLQYGIFSFVNDDTVKIDPQSGVRQYPYHEILKATDKVPKEINVTFGIIWTVVSNPEKEIQYSVIVYTSKYSEKEKWNKVSEKQYTEKTNFIIHESITLDKEEDFKNNHWIIQIMVKNEIRIEKIFELEENG